MNVMFYTWQDSFVEWNWFQSFDELRFDLATKMCQCKKKKINCVCNHLSPIQFMDFVCFGDDLFCKQKTSQMDWEPCWFDYYYEYKHEKNLADETVYLFWLIERMAIKLHQPTAIWPRSSSHRTGFIRFSIDIILNSLSFDSFAI